MPASKDINHSRELEISKRTGYGLRSVQNYRKELPKNTTYNQLEAILFAIIGKKSRWEIALDFISKQDNKDQLLLDQDRLIRKIPEILKDNHLMKLTIKTSNYMLIALAIINVITITVAFFF